MYTIYHIPGIKVGCSIQPDKRVKAQGYDSYEVLEIVSTIEEASEREIHWQVKLGYGRDCNTPYTHFAKTWSGPIREKAIKSYKERGHLEKILAIWRTPEIKKKAKERQKEKCSVEDWNKKLNNPITKAKSRATRNAKRPGILQYDIEGNFIKEWPGCIEVQRELGFKNCQISACCNGRIKSSYGFIWKYKNN